MQFCFFFFRTTQVKEISGISFRMGCRYKSLEFSGWQVQVKELQSTSSSRASRSVARIWSQAATGEKDHCSRLHCRCEVPNPYLKKFLQNCFLYFLRCLVVPIHISKCFPSKLFFCFRYLVVPERPENTEGLSEDELCSLVTRESMIGVATL